MTVNQGPSPKFHDDPDILDLARQARSAFAEQQIASCADLLAQIFDRSGSELLLIDSYEQFTKLSDGEAVMEALAAQIPGRLMFAGRLRPPWLTVRDHIYGRLFELGATQLAFSPTETRKVIMGRRPSEHRAIAEVSRGWPAVVGLAAILAQDLPIDLPHTASLQHYICDEFFVGLTNDQKTVLFAAAVLPSPTYSLVASAVGYDIGELVTDLCGTGALNRSDTGLDFTLSSATQREPSSRHPIRHSATVLPMPPSVRY